MGERLELLIAERDIRARVNALARDIDADYRGKRLSLIVVLERMRSVTNHLAAVIEEVLAFSSLDEGRETVRPTDFLAADLMREIETPCTFDVVSAASYGAGTRSVGMVTLTGLDGLDIAGRDVLVIDDILDTGRTIAAIIDALQQRGPASLALCALLRKPTAIALDLPVAYIGFDIPDEFVVGCGMDYAERHRNLRGIHRLVFDERRED